VVVREGTIGRQPGRRVARGREELVAGERDRPAEGALEGAGASGPLDARRLSTDIRPTAGQPLGRIRDGTAGVVDETQKVALRRRAATPDTAALRLGGRRPAGTYEACSAVGAPLET
jgi:hypothetical protein